VRRVTRARLVEMFDRMVIAKNQAAFDDESSVS
jgi:hypothetical protein